MAGIQETPISSAAGGAVRIDLGALGANWRLLVETAAPATCAAVVKADAYGIGMAPVASTLAAAGCTTFIVASLNEAVALRGVLGAAATILVLNGLLPGTAKDTQAHGIVPVINDLAQLQEWQNLAQGSDSVLPTVLHADTGMNRLGLTPEDVGVVSNEPERMTGLDLKLVMSHLACADDPDNPKNNAQLLEFLRQKAALMPASASMAASSGIFLGPGFHFEIVRPGLALYGGNPTPNAPNPMAEVVQIKGKIVQVRDVDSPQTVGYGAAFPVTKPSILATVAVGYADGILRALGDKKDGKVWGSIGGVSVPVVGRISMDLLTVDVTEVATDAAHPGAWVDLIGGDAMSLEDAAAAAATIPYEILTSMGARYHRQYVGGAD
ncbi:MAG: alanine racemase [Alphaproteobacteria bacterium]|jgi:alanine racemase|nr:alanine racemase [Alphaproteobacteria bacterium]MBT5861119.1 alanine racemase [Alphaproteobacteria bacterium]